MRWGGKTAGAGMLAAVLFLSGACDTAANSGDRPGPSHPASQREANAVLEFVVDGDTIEVTIDGVRERVRLIGIDTPEKAIPERGQTAECFGDRATEFTRSLLPEGTPLYLERDVEPRDDYGRLLAYVYRADDGAFINDEIVRHGYGRPFPYPPNTTFADRFVDAARTAERDDVGLWAEC